jgi:tetratricopeptide (TPR) repeat protein
MPRTREVAVPSQAPELLLRQATLARTSDLRAKYARRGLERGRRLDPTMRAMLLRQLYLSLLEQEKFEEALEVALDSLKTGVMRDVVHQDAARACVGLGDVERAVGHLRLASRLGPASRRSFHCWTLGSVLYLSHRHEEAIHALSRAVRWGTADRPLYRAQLALVKLAAGENVSNLGDLYEQLSSAPCGNGYGQFVLGELSYHAGDLASAGDHLRAFVKRTTAGRVALTVALKGELAQAKRLLTVIRRKTRKPKDTE